MASRIAAAACGGYSLAYVATAAAALLLPVARPDAVLIATLPSFAIYASAILWAFLARTAGAAWRGLLWPTAALAAAAWLARGGS